MSRRKSTAQPSSKGASPEKKSRSPFGFRKTNSSRNFQPMESESVAENGIRPEKTGESASSRRRNSLAQSPPTNESIPEIDQSTTSNGVAIPEATPEEETSVSAATPVTDKSKAQGDTQVGDYLSLPFSSGFLLLIQLQQQQSEVDAEGYSTRPDTFDEITRIQKEAA